MSNFTNFASNKNAVAFKEYFDQVVSQKVTDALDTMKVEVAATMFDSVDEAKETRAEFRLATPDIIAKNNARLAKKKADAAKRLRMKEKRDGGVK